MSVDACPISVTTVITYSRPLERERELVKSALAAKKEERGI